LPGLENLCSFRTHFDAASLSTEDSRVEQRQIAKKFKMSNSSVEEAAVDFQQSEQYGETARRIMRPELSTVAEQTAGVNAKPIALLGPNYVSRSNTPMGHPTSGESYASSVRSMQSSMVDDIKHEVMVNYLFQQQCSSLWIGNGNGTLEGVILRKRKQNYISCPQQLIESPFGLACTALNVQV
jgi:predicted nucleotide-binding protein (sugar kinase/HSP70/actin superfamily)